MEKSHVTLIHEAFLTAGWSESGARSAVLHVQSLTAAAQIVAAAAGVPESVRAVILRDKRHTSDAALIAAFKEAAEINEVLNYCARTATPLALCQIGNYMHRDANGERMMTSAEARKKLISAMAEADQHIDTARPLASEPVKSVAEAADRLWARRAADAKKEAGK